MRAIACQVVVEVCSSEQRRKVKRNFALPRYKIRQFYHYPIRKAAIRNVADRSFAACAACVNPESIILRSVRAGDVLPQSIGAPFQTP